MAEFTFAEPPLGSSADMARILPEDTDAARARCTARYGLETLHVLELTLPNEFAVFQGEHWAGANDGGSVLGELDFLVVNRYDRALTQR